MKEPTKILVDVIQLSKQKCQIPIKCKLRFGTSKNFMGMPTVGYSHEALDVCLLSRQAAHALCQVQSDLLNIKNDQADRGYSLYIYDAYRPKQAVMHFLCWANQAIKQDESRAKKHNPLIPKEQFFAKGYVKENSTHCYGNTIDLELMNLQTGRKLFMGARISYMGTISHSTATKDEIKQEWDELKAKNLFEDIKRQWQKASGEDWDEKKEDDYLQTALNNRSTLAKIMQKNGFDPYEKEWWHYAYQKPEVDAPMDLLITPQLRGLGI